MTNQVEDEVRFWKDFIEHGERVHGEPAPTRAYDALDFSRLRLKCLLEGMAPGKPQDTGSANSR